MEKICRSIAGSETHVENRTVKGLAIVFDTWSQDLGGFKEKILRSALTQEIIDKSDIFATMDHSKDYIMARSKNGKGNLNLEITDRGLEFSFEVPETAKGEELLQHIKRGEIDSCSFQFSLPKNRAGEHWFKENGELRCEITKFDRLWDVACVYNPAYIDTACSARNLEAAKRALEELEKEEGGSK